jgi:hypothetical protein
MSLQSEDGRTVFSLVTSLPLKKTGAIVNHMGENMNFGIVPVY